MSDKSKKLQEEEAKAFLSISSIGRPYHNEELPKIFEDMKRALNKEITTNGFSEAITRLGSHAPKIASPRAKIHGMTFNLPRKNSLPKTWVSGSGALGSHAKILCRPIAITGERGQSSFIERLMSGCRHSSSLEKGFERAFGKDALNAVKEALSQRPEEAGEVTLYGENFSVFYLPGLDGGDLQGSPGGYVDAYVAMNQIRRESRTRSNAWWEAEEERQKKIKAQLKKDTPKDEVDELYPRPPRPPQPRWMITSVSDKMQNAVIGVAGQKTRLFAELPETLDQETADIWRFINGGRFPALRDPGVASIMVKYASLFNEWQKLDHKPNAMTAKLDSLADVAIRRAAWHIEDVKSDIEDNHPSFQEEINSPSIFSLLAGIWIKSAARELNSNVDKETVAGVMRSKHFSSRLKLKGYAE